MRSTKQSYRELLAEKIVTLQVYKLGVGIFASVETKTDEEDRIYNEWIAWFDRTKWYVKNGNAGEDTPQEGCWGINWFEGINEKPETVIEKIKRELQNDWVLPIPRSGGQWF